MTWPDCFNRVITVFVQHVDFKQISTKFQKILWFSFRYRWLLFRRPKGPSPPKRILIYKVYSVQRLQTTIWDWFQIINKVKEKLAIEKSDEEIFEYLEKLSWKHSRSEFTCAKSEFEQEKCLSDVRFSKQDRQLRFRLRTWMTDDKSNFRNLYYINLDFQTCNETCLEDENHLLVRENLKNE
jgi:hypothetical protein